jgi:hypothetical protein
MLLGSLLLVHINFAEPIGFIVKLIAPNLASFADHSARQLKLKSAQQALVTWHRPTLAARAHWWGPADVSMDVDLTDVGLAPITCFPICTDVFESSSV